MSRLERLINLSAALLDAERLLTADELRERVPGYPDGAAAFQRAFSRDKETLREMGIPIVVEALDPANPGSAEGYRVEKDDYYLREPGLAPDELAALHLAASTVRLGGTPATEGLWKLGGDPAMAGDGAALAELPGSEHLTELFAAVGERRPTSFDYRAKARTVDPYQLSFRSGHWYLVARDHDHDEVRSFRLDRIESQIALGPPGSFVPPAGAGAGPVKPWELGDEPEVVATLVVDADQAAWAVRHLGDDAVLDRRTDGGVTLAVRVTNRPAFRSFVLGFLDHAEVVAPADLRNEIVEWLEALCRR
jgi:proteasome accessory factor B